MYGGSREWRRWAPKQLYTLMESASSEELRGMLNAVREAAQYDPHRTQAGKLIDALEKLISERRLEERSRTSGLQG